MGIKVLSPQTRSTIITYAIVIVAFVAVTLLDGMGLISNSLSGQLVPICAYVSLAVSLNLVVGVSGELSLGHAGFMSVGAFTGVVVAGCLARMGVESELVLFAGAAVVGAIAAGIIGFLVGIPVMRLRGDYLAIVTLAFGEIIKNLLNNFYIGIDDAGLHFSMKDTASLGMNQGTILINGQDTSGKSVVLVECDMRRRSMGQMIGVRSRGGLYAVLSEQMKLEEAVVETSQKNLYFLDSEPHIPNPADIIASRRFKRLVERLRASFQYVIFDTPPVGTFIDAAEVGQLSDGVLFVVRENFAKRAEVTAAFDQLRRAEVHVIGAVMNYCETETSEYYYSYYTKDGKKARSSEGSSRGAAQGVVPSAVQASGSRFSRQ